MRPREELGRSTKGQRTWLFIALLGGSLAAAPCGRAAETPAPPRSPLDAVAALEKPVTYVETKIPLGELVARVAADTGVQLSAAPDVADEPVAVVVKAMPARELLEQLAGLLDYRWHVQGFGNSVVQGFRRWGNPSDPSDPSDLITPSPERRNAGTPERPVAYEIYQDLAAKQREAALREARLREVERRFWEEVRRYSEIAALRPEQIQSLVEADDQRVQEAMQPAAAPQAPLARSPEEQERVKRAMAARQLTAPIPRALAHLVSRLSPEQWAALSAEQPMTFSTAPGAGEQAMPAETARALRASLPTPPPMRFFDPREEVRARERDRQAQEQWPMADGYRVSFRLDAGRLQTEGLLSLSARATGIRAAAGSPPLGGGNLYVSSGPIDVRQPLPEDTPQREAELAKGPVTGASKSFRPERKPAPFFGPNGPKGWRLRDLLPDLGRTYDVSILADAYSNTTLGPIPVERLPTQPVALFALLDRLAGFNYEWDRVPAQPATGRLIRLRSRTWFLDRPREIPMRLVRRWKAVGDRHGGLLPLEEYVETAADLTDVRLRPESIGSAMRDAAILPPWPDFSGVYAARHALRLYALLPASQRLALWRGGAIATARMTSPERALFLAALREGNRLRESPGSLDQWARGSFSLTTQSFVRNVEPDGVSMSIRPMPPRPDAPPGARQMPPGPGSGPAGSASASGSAAPQQFLQVRFQFEYGPRMFDSVSVSAAPPS